MDAGNLDPREALSAWSIAPTALTPIAAGHINRTWRVEHGDLWYALQWLNPIFKPELHFDIEAITARLEAAGLTTPRLVRTAAGELWTTAEGGVWRLLTWIEGESVLVVDGPDRAHQAGRLLGQFHAALLDWEHPFHFERPHVHDTPRHLRHLEQALADQPAHRNRSLVEPLATEILALARRATIAGELPRRVVHGDPKISNFVFAPDGRAVALIDLDTLARMPIAVELGDAFRSWCNPQGEEVAAAFELALFEAGWRGYRDAIGDRVDRDELATVPRQIRLIALELAARFCADALEESYFNWNRDRFASASEHNLARTRSQLALARSVGEQLARLESVAGLDRP
ncbi:MAG: aminoglycoside phosphotransferase family protein [Deltaproteobacteria bacterium]|nr:aminoglycoside phosphotransferase family protein [Deltaproteobacteria bacterium]